MGMEAVTSSDDFKKIRDNVNTQIVEWFIREQDSSTMPPMEYVSVNYENYDKLGVIYC